MNKKLLDKIFENRDFMDYNRLSDSSPLSSYKDDSDIIIIEQNIQTRLETGKGQICWCNSDYLCEHRIEYIKRAVLKYSNMTREEQFAELI